MFKLISIDRQRLETVRGARKYFVSMPRHTTICWRWQRHSPVTFQGRAWLFDYYSQDAYCKIKYDTPRLELDPWISIVFFGFMAISVRWYFPKEMYPDMRTGDYWEQWTWIQVCGGNVAKARDTWPWMTRDGKSTWKDIYLKESPVLDFDNFTLDKA